MGEEGKKVYVAEYRDGRVVYVSVPLDATVEAVGEAVIVWRPKGGYSRLAAAFFGLASFRDPEVGWDNADYATVADVNQNRVTVFR